LPVKAGSSKQPSSHFSPRNYWLDRPNLKKRVLQQPLASKPRSTHRHRVLQTVADRISQGADAISVASALSELYLSVLQRILQIRPDLDRARQLQRAHDPAWKQSARAARFACKDEKEYLCLVDQACRGLCDCLGIRSRISFEAIAKINERKYPDPSEELKRKHTGDLMMITMLKKAILYNLDIPYDLLHADMPDGLSAYLDSKMKEKGNSEG
jgi:hypothetical protein